MIKKVTNLLFLSLILLSSCSQKDEIADVSGAQKESTVELVISRAAADEFSQAGISEVTIYTYRVLRKSTELFSEQTVAIGDGQFSYQFPLGETFQAIVTANVSSVTGKESLETLALNFDPLGGKEVWASKVVRFNSDKSVQSLDLAMERLVARINFVPAESAADLAAVTEFDRLDITFTNIAATYMPATGKPTLSDITVTADAASGFRTRLYSFATDGGDQKSALNILYYKNGQKVNQSASMLDTGTTYEASGDYAVTVPITSPDFLLGVWDVTARSGFGKSIQVTKSQL